MKFALSVLLSLAAAKQLPWPDSDAIEVRDWADSGRELPVSLPTPSTSSASPSSSGKPGGPNCGKGYTYCGYMLTSRDHKFAAETVNNTYCADGKSQGLCPDGVPKTSTDQAVFLCLDEAGPIMLACACSDQCLNQKSTNNIAHCEKPCTNGKF